MSCDVKTTNEAMSKATTNPESQLAGDSQKGSKEERPSIRQGESATTQTCRQVSRAVPVSGGRRSSEAAVPGRDR
jgi:hypothetical protein